MILSRLWRSFHTYIHTW